MGPVHIMLEQLKFCKVCACWVLRWLTEEQKNIQNGSVLAVPQSVHWGRRGLHGTNCYRRWVLGALLSTRIWKDLPWNGNIPSRQQNKSSRLFHHPATLCSLCFGTCKGHTLEIPASRWECECRVILHHSAGTTTSCSPQTTWTPDKGSDSSGWQCPPSHSKSNAGAVTNISLRWLGTSNVHPLPSVRAPKWCCNPRGYSLAATATKRLLFRQLSRTCKTTG